MVDPAFGRSASTGLILCCAALISAAAFGEHRLGATYIFESSREVVRVSEHPNAVLYREAFEGFMRGDGSAAELLSEDIVWWQIGSDEPVRGREALMESMSMMESLDFEADLHDVTASDDHVVGLVTATVKVGDQEFTYRTAEIAHVRDGKISERWAFSDDTEAITEFFSQFTSE